MEAVDSEDILQFCAITSADPEVASSYLTVCDGDIERAISLYMESGGADLRGIVSPTNNNTSSNSGNRGSRRSRSASNERNSGGYDDAFDQDAALARSLQEQDNIRAPIAPRHEMLLGDEYDTHTGPGYGGSSRSRGAPSVFLPPDSTLGVDAFRDFRAEAATMGGETSPRTSKLADLFKAPLDIMTRGDFEHCRKLAKDNNKWLMVNIQDPTVFACQTLNRDLWSSQKVKEVIRESFVFLQEAHVEGKKYIAYYPLKTYPHIAIIDPRTAERMLYWSKSMDPDQFLEEVGDFLHMHSLADSSSKPSQPKKTKIVKDVLDMTEEEQLQAAINASMGSGGESSSAVEADNEATPAESEAEATPAAPEDNLTPFERIQPVDHPEPSDPASSTRIGFRLSDGSRLMHRFSKAAPVLVLFEFIKAKVEDARTQPFELVFLGRQLIDDLDKTLAEVGVENAQIMVQM
ncbi:hypothetical protein BGW38_000227 [Lunasporangiospora selenospora]|uniref:UBX domain-containing protein n=1 Tax=Lunasporangiospora selenospora TaxID=979761 RepID=A0A9P6FV54_9FUNG|nr:hypothetical protein BGW38_000227 [Lunasporangiospora selenospora]